MMTADGYQGRQLIKVFVALPKIIYFSIICLILT